MTVTLYAYRYSVYSWIARLVLSEKGVGYDTIEVNPFASNPPAEYLTKHPFRRVPVLIHDDFPIYETAAITRYVDETFKGEPLQPSAARARARMAQIISIIDAYGYWPMVRQVFSHRVFRPRTGQPADETEVQSGLRSSEGTLAALESLAERGGYLVGSGVSLADLHLAPMMAYFTAAEEGTSMLRRHEKLSAWWELMRKRPAFIATEPPVPGP
jgi:glutathione S-transferase